MINGTAMHPRLTVKAIILNLSFYQSFDGPASIPSMANMPLDDITIRNWLWTYMSWSAQSKKNGMRIGESKFSRNNVFLMTHPIEHKSTMLKNSQTNLS